MSSEIRTLGGDERRVWAEMMRSNGVPEQRIVERLAEEHVIVTRQAAPTGRHVVFDYAEPIRIDRIELVGFTTKPDGTVLCTLNLTMRGAPSYNHVVMVKLPAAVKPSS